MRDLTHLSGRAGPLEAAFSTLRPIALTALLYMCVCVAVFFLSVGPKGILGHDA